MDTLFIYFVAFRFVACIGGLIFSFKIARMSITPVKTWILFTLGWAFWLAQNVAYFFFVNPIEQTLTAHSPLSYLTIVGGALVVLFFFAATVRVYFELKGKFKNIL